MYEEVLFHFGNTIDKVLQSPSQDRILYIYYYQQSDLCAPVCDLGTLWPLVRFFILSGNKDLKCGEFFDNFCYIKKSFCSIKKRMGAMLANFGPLVQNMGRGEIEWT